MDAVCTDARPWKVHTFLSCFWVARSSSASWLKKASTTILRASIALRTPAGSVASAWASTPSFCAAVGAGLGAVVVAAPGAAVAAGVAVSPARALAADSAVTFAFSAAWTALPGADWAVLPGCFAGAVVAAGAGGGISSVFGRRNIIQAARTATAATRTIRMGGEIWLITHRLSANRRGSLRGLSKKSTRPATAVNTSPDRPLARRSVAPGLPGSGRRLRRESQAELGELAGVDRRGRPGQRVRAAGGLRECDHVADRVAARDQRHHAVDTER